MTPILPIPTVTAVDRVPVKNEWQNKPVSGAISAVPISADSGATALTEDQKVEQQVRTWVAQTFFGTLLKQMRDSPFKSEMFSGGRGGEAFGNLYDQHIVQRMAVGAGAKLVKSISKKFLNSSKARTAADAKKAYGEAKRRPVDDLQRGTSPLSSPSPAAAPKANQSVQELPRVATGLRA